MSNNGVTPSCLGSAPAQPVEAVFARLFEECRRILWCIAAGIVGNAATAEDIVQEAALIGLGKFDQFQMLEATSLEAADSQSHERLVSAFSAWMGQIVRYTALNQYRKERFRKTVDLPAAYAERSPRGPAAGRPLELTCRGQLPEDQQAFDDRVVEALQEVSEVARACLLLRTLEAMDYARIARLMAIPEGTAMSHVHRARQHLRRRLSPPNNLTTKTPRTPREDQIREG